MHRHSAFLACTGSILLLLSLTGHAQDGQALYSQHMQHGDGPQGGGQYAPPGTLYDNLISDQTTSLVSQDSNGDFTARTADDFIIEQPACGSGQFLITRIRTQMVQMDSTPQAFAVDLYDDNGAGTAPTPGINPIATVAQTSQANLGAFGVGTSLFEAAFEPQDELILEGDTIYWVSGFGTDAAANAGGFNNYFATSNGAAGTSPNGVVIAPGAGVGAWTPIQDVIGPPAQAFSFAIDGDCVALFSVGGTVSGLTGSGLVLQNNGGDDLAIPNDGPFVFDTPLNDADNYAVTVLQQPSDPSQTCTVANGSGPIDGEDVTDIVVTCEIDTYSVTASAGANGGISPNVQVVAHGDTAQLTITPDPGYSPSVGGTCPAGNLAGMIYTTGAIVADCEVTASFSQNPADSLTLDGGDGQSTPVGSGFGMALAVRVSDIDDSPLPGITVAFEVQPGANGAAAQLSAGQAQTDAQGIAQVDATANEIAGDHSVSAAIVGSAIPPVTFALTNTALASDVSLSASAASVTEGETVLFTAEVSSAGQVTADGQRGAGILPTGSVDFHADGLSLCDAVPLDAGVAECASAALPIGHHVVTADYSGDAGHMADSDSVGVTVGAGTAPPPASIPVAGRTGLVLLVLLLLVAGLAATRVKI